jgi:hypothetical protein
MDDLNEILESAAASPRHTFDSRVLEDRIRSRRRRRAVMRTAAVTMLVVVGLGAIVAAAGRGSGTTVVPTRSTAVPSVSTLPATTNPTPLVESTIPTTVVESTVPTTVVEPTVPTTSSPPLIGASMTVTIVDGVNQPFPATKSGLRACRLIAGAADCSERIDSVDEDGNGIVEIVLRDDIDYVVNAFAHDTGWPCPSIDADGTPFHHSDKRDVLAGESIDGLTLAITRPNPDVCSSDLPSLVINLYDESGESLAGTGAFVDLCGYDPLFPVNYPIGQQHTGCSSDSGFVHQDQSGIIRVHVNPALTYDVSSFIKCADGSFLVGDHNRTPGGYSVWTTTATDLLTNGLDLTIRGNVDTCVGGS